MKYISFLRSQRNPPHLHIPRGPSVPESALWPPHGWLATVDPLFASDRVPGARVQYQVCGSEIPRPTTWGI